MNIARNLLGRDDKPGVLVMGRTGVGKSTLVNALLKREAAQTGVGAPVTDEFTCYPNKEMPFNLCDSPGWEGGDTNEAEYLRGVNQFLKRGGKHVRLIWYAVDAPGTRFTDYDARLLQNSFNNLPIFIVLTKCDIASDDQIIGLLKAVIEARVPQIHGAFETAAHPHEESEIPERFRFTHLIERTQAFLEK